MNYVEQIRMPRSLLADLILSLRDRPSSLMIVHTVRFTFFGGCYGEKLDQCAGLHLSSGAKMEVGGGEFSDRLYLSFGDQPPFAGVVCLHWGDSAAEAGEGAVRFVGNFVGDSDSETPTGGEGNTCRHFHWHFEEPQRGRTDGGSIRFDAGVWG